MKPKKQKKCKCKNCVEIFSVSYCPKCKENRVKINGILHMDISRPKEAK